MRGRKRGIKERERERERELFVVDYELSTNIRFGIHVNDKTKSNKEAISRPRPPPLSS